MRVRPLVLALLLVTAACAGRPGEEGSPFYQAGFGDGCASAAAEMGPVPRPAQRDEALFAKDEGYRTGWISGHAACRMQGGGPNL